MASVNNVATLTVADIMTDKVETLSASDTIKFAASLMVDSQVTTIPVVDGKQHCIGILSRTDLTEMFLSEDEALSSALDSDRLSAEWLNRSLDTSESRLVKEFMNYEVATIRSDKTVSAACKEMVKRKIHHLPVVDESDVVVGIVSTFDIVKAVAQM